MELPKWLRTADDPVGRYWFRCPMGLEQLLSEEISDHLSCEHIHNSHRNVWISTNWTKELPFAAVKLADDVYYYLGCCSGVDRTRPSLDILLHYFQHTIIPRLSSLPAQAYFRITLSFVGKRNYSRFFVENKLNDLLRHHTTFQPLSNELKQARKVGEYRLRCHIEDDTVFWGLGFQDVPLHRRSWRHIRYDGQLHTTVAAAMARALDREKAQVIIDPFCGSGTLLIESALLSPSHAHFGFDISSEAIDTARGSAEMAGIQITFTEKDSLSTEWPAEPFLLLSNPPWDEKHQIDPEKRLIFIRQLVRLVQASKGGVLLLPEEMALEMEKIGDIAMNRLAQTRIRGKLAWLLTW